MKRLLFFVLFILIAFFFGCKKTAPRENPTPEVPPAPVNVPKLQTNSVANLTHFSVVFSGKLLDTVGTSVTETGFVIDTLPTPTITRKLNKFISKPDAAGNFSTTLIDLLDSTKVYLRAYAVNSHGVGYGNEVVFSTLKERSVNGLIVLTNQAEVENFGAKNYTFIVSLEITGSVTDLTPLRSLTKISTSLEIKNTTKLRNLKGLENLEIVGYNFPHHLRIHNNFGLTSLDGLNNLKIVKGECEIINNDSLTDLQGLDNFTTSVGGDFVIADCANLRSLNGLNKLMVLDEVLSIRNNPLLTDTRALSNNTITFLDKAWVHITNNPSLQNLDGFVRFQNLYVLEIKNNNLLNDISGFKNLQTLNSLMIDGNPLLSNLSAFANLTTLDYLNLTNSMAVTDLTGFRNLETVVKWLTLNNNAGLKNFTGLEKVRMVGRLEVAKNASLVSFQGFNNLVKVVGNAYSITVARNNSLQSLSGFENLKEVQGMVSFGFNPLLSNFCGIKPLILHQPGFLLITEGNLANPLKADIIANCN